MSSPWKRIAQPEPKPGGVSGMPMMVSVARVPVPVSPSTASVSPASTWYDTPLITLATPSRVRNSTCRSSTSSRRPGCCPDVENSGSLTVMLADKKGSLPQLGVEGLAHGLTHRHETQHRDHQESGREEQQLRRHPKVVLRLADHDAPGLYGRLEADAEERQCRLGPDERAQHDRGVDQ